MTASTNLRRWLPVASLRPWVSTFGLRRAALGAAQSYQPLHARADFFLEFYLEDRYHVVDVATGTVRQAPASVLVGPQTRRREDLIYAGTLRVFNIRFSAVGFRALFGIAARAVSDHALSADSVLGPEVQLLQERLSAARDTELQVVAERFLLDRLRSARLPASHKAVASMAKHLSGAEDVGSVAELAVAYGFGARQVERLFQDQVGLSPKTYARVHRLGRALGLAKGRAKPDWAAIAAETGYFDQSHLVRDFGASMGTTPGGFAALHKRAMCFHTAARSREENVAFVLSGSGVAP